MEYGFDCAASVRASGNVKLLFVSTTNMCGSALGNSGRTAANSSRGVTVRDAGTPAVAMLKPLQHCHIFKQHKCTAVHLPLTVDKLAHKGDASGGCAAAGVSQSDRSAAATTRGRTNAEREMQRARSMKCTKGHTQDRRSDVCVGFSTMLRLRELQVTFGALIKLPR